MQPKCRVGECYECANAISAIPQPSFSRKRESHSQKIGCIDYFSFCLYFSCIFFNLTLTTASQYGFLSLLSSK